MIGGGVGLKRTFLSSNIHGARHTEGLFVGIGDGEDLFGEPGHSGIFHGPEDGVCELCLVVLKTAYGQEET